MAGRLQVLEVPRYGQEDVASLLVRASRRGVPGVAPRLDHRYHHPGVFEPVGRELGQGGSDAAALVVGVDGQHGYLAHAPLRMMMLDRHEADGGPVCLGDPHPPLFRGADILYRAPLILSPVRMQPPENLGTQHPLERRKDRRPRPQLEVDHRPGVSIVEWPNSWPHRLSTSRHLDMSDLLYRDLPLRFALRVFL
jgi:hypothetical protein